MRENSKSAWRHSKGSLQGHFNDEDDIHEGAREIIVADWTDRRRRRDQQRWEGLFETGLVLGYEAEMWADEAWPEEREIDWDDPDLMSMYTGVKPKTGG